MSAVVSESVASDVRAQKFIKGWLASFLLYAAFAAAVFVAQGNQPALGSDHLSYFQLTDSILAACRSGEYWREMTSTQNYGVMLAYLHGWTGSHVLSMKVALAVFTVLYLLAAELFFRLFTPVRRRVILFAVLSAFAVSFGISSWGVTDSTALLPRTLVAPVLMLAFWIWFRFDGRAWKYLAFPLLVLGSLLHLGAFYAAGVLMLLELWDFVVLRRARIDRLVPAWAGGVVASIALLFCLEHTGLSNRVIGVQVPEMARAFGMKVENLDLGDASGCRRTPTRAARIVLASLVPVALPDPVVVPPKLTAQEAWAIELKLRPWRNMPLPLVNLANVLSSSLLILLLAGAGMVVSRRVGFTRTDHLMVGMFIAVPLFAFAPQTILWGLRSFTSVYPVTIEEVRALGLIMIPALYFILRLYERVVSGDPRTARRRAAWIVIGVLILPLMMKGLTRPVREQILSAMMTLHVVDPANEARVANARAALGLGAATAPLYYSTVGVRQWLSANAGWGARILTDRDDLILLRDKTIIGTRQAGAMAYYVTGEEADVFLQTSRAMARRDLPSLARIAQAHKVDFIVVPWKVAGAAYSDEDFSVVSAAPGRKP
jgi:hypothetical protein